MLLIGCDFFKINAGLLLLVVKKANRDRGFKTSWFICNKLLINDFT
jgi:hypothetical protein